MHGYRLIIISCSYQHLQCHISCYVILPSHRTLLLFTLIITCLLYFRVHDQFMADIGVQLDILMHH